MAVRNDIHVEWYRSPRAIIVEAPSTELTVQDLVDTIREIEEELDSLDNPFLIYADGKQALSLGAVGITVTLNNAQILFEERTYPSMSGTASSATQHDGLPGQILYDSGADFSTLTSGDEVCNKTDGSKASVIDVIDSTHIRHYPLTGGTTDEWTLGDDYNVQIVAICSVTQGNVTALDDLGGTIDPVIPANGVSYSVEQSTSPAQASAQEFRDQLAAENALRELLQPGHPALGSVYYWDPVNGKDVFNGTSPAKAVETFARAHALVTAYNFDVIICVAGNVAGVTVVDDRIVVTKATTIIRGPGRTFRLLPTVAGSPTVSVSAPHVALSEVDVHTPAGGTDIGISLSGDDLLIRYVHVHGATSHGINIQNSRNSHLEFLQVHDCDGDGILVGASVEDLSIESPLVADNAGDGIDLSGQPEKTMIFGDVRILGNGLYGLLIPAGTVQTTLDGRVVASNNSSGDIEDNGTRTEYLGQILAGSASQKVWDALLADHAVDGSFGAEVASVGSNVDIVKADVAFIKNIEGGRWQLTDEGQMIFFGEDNVTEVARFNMRDSSDRPTVKDFFERVRV